MALACILNVYLTFSIPKFYWYAKKQKLQSLISNYDGTNAGNSGRADTQYRTGTLSWTAGNTLIGYNFVERKIRVWVEIWGAASTGEAIRF